MPGAGIMNGACQCVLSGAHLATDQNAGPRAGRRAHKVAHALHLRRLTGNIAECQGGCGPHLLLDHFTHLLLGAQCDDDPLQPVRTFEHKIQTDQTMDGPSLHIDYTLHIGQRLAQLEGLLYEGRQAEKCICHLSHHELRRGTEHLTGSMVGMYHHMLGVPDQNAI